MRNIFYYLAMFFLLCSALFAQEEISNEEFFFARAAKNNWNTSIAIEDAKYDLKVGGIIILIGDGYYCKPIGIKKKHQYLFEKYEAIKVNCTDLLNDWTIKTSAYAAVYNQTILKELHGIEY